MKHFGPDVSKWELPHRSNQKVRPPDFLKVTERDYVINKTAHDGFISSNIDFILKNLGVKNLFFCGGHTNCCVRFTAASAIKKGYNSILVEDACIDLLTKLHKEGVESVQYKEIVTTQLVLKALENFSRQHESVKT